MGRLANRLMIGWVLVLIGAQLGTAVAAAGGRLRVRQQGRVLRRGHRAGVDGVPPAGCDLRRTEATLADPVAHTRTLLVTDLGRVQERREADRVEARSRLVDLEHRIGQMARPVEATLDGISDIRRC